MDANMNSKITLLEEEIVAKDRIISQLHHEGVIGFILGGFLHEMMNGFVSLGLELENFFIICSEKGFDSNEFNKIRQIYERLRKLIETFRYLAFKHDGNNLIDLSDCIERPLQIILPEALKLRIKLDVHIEEKIKLVKLPDSLINVVINILLNSLESLALANNNIPKSVQINAKSIKDMIRIQIIDNGVGIDPEIIDKIWIVGFTTKSNHSGLGLKISKSVLDEMNGKVAIASVFGKFTRVTISLPTR